MANLCDVANMLKKGEEGERKGRGMGEEGERNGKGTGKVWGKAKLSWGSEFDSDSYEVIY